MVKKNIIESKSFRQFLRFVIVGVISTIIDLGIYNIFAIGFDKNIYLSRFISFTVAVIIGYFLHRNWTFKSNDEKVLHQFIRFIFTATTGLAINLIVMRIVSNYTNSISEEILRKNVPVLIAVGIASFWNFFINKYWTFKEKK